MGERRLRILAKALCDKLMLVHASQEYKGIWSFAHTHGMAYDGPTYAGELSALKDFLNGEPKEPEKKIPDDGYHQHCKVCAKGFHYCSSYGYDADLHQLIDAYCSWECLRKDVGLEMPTDEKEPPTSAREEWPGPDDILKMRGKNQPDEWEAWIADCPFGPTAKKWFRNMPRGK